MKKEENLPPPATACGVLCQFLILLRGRVRHHHLITSDVPLDRYLHHKRYCSVLKAENEPDSETCSGFCQQPERFGVFSKLVFELHSVVPKNNVKMLSIEEVQN